MNSQLERTPAHGTQHFTGHGIDAGEMKYASYFIQSSQNMFKLQLENKYKMLVVEIVSVMFLSCFIGVN